MTRPTPDQTIEDAVGIAYRDLRSEGFSAEAASDRALRALCDAVAVLVAHRRHSEEDRRDVECRVLAVCTRIDNEAHKLAGYGAPQRMEIGGKR